MEIIEANQFNLSAIKQALAITSNITLVIDFKCCIIGLILDSPCPVYIYWKVIQRLSQPEIQVIKEIFSIVNCLSCKYKLEIIPCSDKESLISSIVQGIINSIEIDLNLLKQNAYKTFRDTLKEECEMVEPPKPEEEVNPINYRDCCYRFR